MGRGRDGDRGKLAYELIVQMVAYAKVVAGEFAAVHWLTPKEGCSIDALEAMYSSLHILYSEAPARCYIPSTLCHQQRPKASPLETHGARRWGRLCRKRLCGQNPRNTFWDGDRRRRLIRKSNLYGTQILHTSVPVHRVLIDTPAKSNIITSPYCHV